MTDRSRGPARSWTRRALLLASVVALAAFPSLLGPAAGSRIEAGLATEGDEPGRLMLAWMRLRGPPIVGLQVGHLRADEHPQELARLRVSTGGSAFGVDEVDVNMAVARALERRLAAHGIRVELLPATLPPGYRADVLLSLHADASDDPLRRGYKSAHARHARNRLEPRLQAAIDSAYLATAPLPSDRANVSGAMLDYYAFDARRYRHAAHRATPALIVEMGYLSHDGDRRWLLQESGPATVLAEGVMTYLAAVGRWHPRAAP